MNKWKWKMPGLNIWFWVLIGAFMVFLLIQYIIRPIWGG